MTVALDAGRLTTSASAAETLAAAIREQVAAARSASPVALPSLDGLEAKAAWLDEQVPMLSGLADIAALLDETGQGRVELSMSDIKDKLQDFLGNAMGVELGNIFDGDDFWLVDLGLAIGKMTRMAKGVAPIPQTGMITRPILLKLAQGSGRAAQWANWLLSGPSHLRPPSGLFPAPKWTRLPGPLSNAGWSPLTKGGSLTGLGLMRGLGVAGGVYSTATGVMNLVEQGNPIDAFEREGAGYVADVAETAFSASTTAFLVAPNPVTAGLAVGTGLVWAGAEIVDNWDDIAEGAGEALDTVKDTASKAWDKVSFWD